ncbi:hypothetical protein MTR67_031467 [Solanum verrucosum]|uniref:Retrotransposon gag domain-containing protein n=1 Tax=Solanum verrucosum TaxID=315347 RepID=A0AAF0U2L3_SOLVR|nr:hypothetical protein MTR67_031467 [Solanum verrucosum]
MSNFEPLFKCWQAMTTQANREDNAPVNPNVGTMTVRIQDFTRMDPLEFHGSKVDEDPQELLNEIYKIVEVKVFEFINIRQGNMSLKEYALNFTQLAKYALTMVVDSRERMSKFVSGVSDLIVKECHTAMLIKEMNISRLMIHAQQVQEEKLKERAKESKRARTSDSDFSHFKSGGQGLPHSGGSFPVKVPLMIRLISLIRIGCLTLNLKEMVDMGLLSPLALGVARNMTTNA